MHSSEEGHSLTEEEVLFEKLWFRVFELLSWQISKTFATKAVFNLTCDAKALKHLTKRNCLCFCRLPRYPHNMHKHGWRLVCFFFFFEAFESWKKIVLFPVCNLFFDPVYTVMWSVASAKSDKTLLNVAWFTCSNPVDGKTQNLHFQKSQKFDWISW